MLPEGWSSSELRHSIRIHSGVAPSALNISDCGTVPYVKVEDLNNTDKLQLTSRTFVDKDEFTVPVNSVIFPKRGAAIFSNKVRIAALPMVLDTNLMAVECVTDIDPEFLYYAITNAGLYKLADTSSIPQLNNKHVLPYRLPRPGMLEQKKIVSILATWDTAIATKAKLLAISRKQKQVFMQQLLTGKRRLQKFVISTARLTTRFGSIPADWRHVPIEQVTCEFSAKNAADRQLPVLSCTKYGGLVDSLSYFKKQVFSQDVSTYKLVGRGCFAYATNHIDEGSIGYQNLYDEALISPMYTVFKPGNEIDHGFLFKLLKTEHYRQIFAANTNASVDRRGSLRWGDFKKIEIPLPSMAEQAAISGIIDSAQLEVESIERQLEKLKDEKRALMQQLLTGKRRVPLPATDAARP